MRHNGIGTIVLWQQSPHAKARKRRDEANMHLKSGVYPNKYVCAVLSMVVPPKPLECPVSVIDFSCELVKIGRISIDH